MRCPACGGKTFSNLVAVRATLTWARCRGCGSWVRNPLPTAEEQASLYRPGYYRAWGADAAALERRAQEKRRTFSRWLARLPVCPPRRLLDVGCAFGFLLDVAVAGGWDAHGLEISPEGVAVSSRRHPDRVFAGTLSETTFPQEWFTAVSLCDVLEHLPDPDPALQRVHALLAPEGTVLISTPNTKSLSCRFFGRIWPHIKAEHLVLYSPEGLARLLARHGFQVTERTAAWKYLSPAFLADHFASFPIPGITACLNALRHALPAALAERSFLLTGGEMLVVARKR